MNGRMYDANLGRFLSPDNFIQDPYNTQSFNRYGYVWNNPLKFNDPSGEISWRSIGKWIKTNSKAITAGITIVAAVGLTIATAGIASPLLAGAIVGAGAGFAGGAVGTWTSGGSFLDGLGNGLLQGVIGGVTGAIGAGTGAWAANNIGSVAINGLKISGSAIKGFVGGAIGGGLGGFASGTTGALLSGANIGDAFNAGLKGAGMGAVLGGLVGAGRGFRHAKLNNLNPWNGELKLNKSIGAAYKGFSKVKSLNQLNKLQQTGKLPKTITRFDKGKILGELDHVHFNNGSALNVDGTWKHGYKILTNKEIKILVQNGWRLPR